MEGEESVSTESPIEPKRFRGHGEGMSRGLSHGMGRGRGQVMGRGHSQGGLPGFPLRLPDGDGDLDGM